MIGILHFVPFQTLGLCIVTGARLSADFPEKAPRETVPKMPVFAFYGTDDNYIKEFIFARNQNFTQQQASRFVHF